MRWRSIVAIACAAPVACAGAVAAASAAPPTTTTAPPSTGPSTPTTAPSASSTRPATTPTTLTSSTTVAPTTVPDRLAGVNWIQASYPSPCAEGVVQLVAGSAVVGASRAVLDDVVPLDPAAGLALAFLSCRAPGATTTQTTAVVMRARSGSVEPLAERELGAAARVVAVDPPRFTVEAPASPARRRLTLTAAANGFRVTGDEQLPASAQPAAAAVGADAGLVRRSIPAAALCYRWDGVWLTVPGEPPDGTALGEPSFELQSLRLALIHLTGRWIDPTGEMNAEMAAVVGAYQQARGLVVDGAIGNQTTRAVAEDLGCADTGGFTMVAPTGLGPRGFTDVAQLVAATDRFARTGRSGYASIDQLLRDSHWDGRNALFLGCYRRESPSTGVACGWSGTTPIELVGLVDDPASPGLGTFSILYARSTAA